MGKVFDRYGRVSAIDHKYTGEEPTWDKCESWPIDKFMNERSRMFNFYNYYCSAKDLFNDLLKWMPTNGYTKQQIKAIKSEGECCVSITCLKLARAMNNGMAPTRKDVMEYVKTKHGLAYDEPHNDLLYLKKNIDSVIRSNNVKIQAEIKLNAEVSNVKEIIISPLQRLSNKVNAKIIAHLEAMIDDNNWANDSVKVEGINLIQLLKANDIPVKGLKEVHTWLEHIGNSLQCALDKDNEFDVEGWAFTTKVGIKNRLKAIQTMLAQVEKYRGANTKARKPRKKKVKSADAQVKAMKYKVSDDDFGLSSIAPSSIPGSTKLIAFNTKYRRLIVYQASSKDGFSVKGTTLQNFNESNSYELTIRKPDDILPVVTKKTEKQIFKVVDALKTNRKPPNGRINKETILLRIF